MGCTELILSHTDLYATSYDLGLLFDDGRKHRRANSPLVVDFVVIVCVELIIVFCAPVFCVRIILGNGGSTKLFNKINNKMITSNDILIFTTNTHTSFVFLFASTRPRAVATSS